MAYAKRPIFDLEIAKQLVEEGRYRITGRAGRDALALGFSEPAICDCFQQLSSACFHKTLASTKEPGTEQDVYYIMYSDVYLYVKFRLDKYSGVIVISFHENIPL
jgi:hypothetical protein